MGSEGVPPLRLKKNQMLSRPLLNIALWRVVLGPYTMKHDAK